MEPSTWDMYMSTMRNETMVKHKDRMKEILELQAKNDKLRELLGMVLNKWLEDANPDELAWLVNSAKMEL